MDSWDSLLGHTHQKFSPPQNSLKSLTIVCGSNFGPIPVFSVKTLDETLDFSRMKERRDREEKERVYGRIMAVVMRLWHEPKDSGSGFMPADSPCISFTPVFRHMSILNSLHGGLLQHLAS